MFPHSEPAVWNTVGVDDVEGGGHGHAAGVEAGLAFWDGYAEIGTIGRPGGKGFVRGWILEGHGAKVEDGGAIGRAEAIVQQFRAVVCVVFHGENVVIGQAEFSAGVRNGLRDQVAIRGFQSAHKHFGIVLGIQAAGQEFVQRSLDDACAHGFDDAERPGIVRSDHAHMGETRSVNALRDCFDGVAEGTAIDVLKEQIAWHW